MAPRPPRRLSHRRRRGPEPGPSPRSRRRCRTGNAGEGAAGALPQRRACLPLGPLFTHFGDLSASSNELIKLYSLCCQRGLWGNFMVSITSRAPIRGGREGRVGNTAALKKRQAGWTPAILHTQVPQESVFHGPKKYSAKKTNHMRGCARPPSHLHYLDLSFSKCPSRFLDGFLESPSGRD